jgi:hypothetical protein
MGHKSFQIHKDEISQSLSIFDKFLTKIAYPALADMGF